MSRTCINQTFTLILPERQWTGIRRMRHLSGFESRYSHLPIKRLKIYSLSRLLIRKKLYIATLQQETKKSMRVDFVAYHEADYEHNFL